MRSRVRDGLFMIAIAINVTNHIRPAGKKGRVSRESSRGNFYGRAAYLPTTNASARSFDTAAAKCQDSDRLSISSRFRICSCICTRCRTRLHSKAKNPRPSKAWTEYPAVSQLQVRHQTPQAELGPARFHHTFLG